jgi:Cft2 family RNA processing exonuclease
MGDVPRVDAAQRPRLSLHPGVRIGDGDRWAGGASPRASSAGPAVHADRNEILAWLRTAPRSPRACYVVHGEPHASAALAQRITDELGWCALVPRDGERVRLD